MGIFGNSSPFDADVEKATCENNTNEEWGLILEICDRAGASPQAARDCLRAVLRRLAHPDPHVQVHAATLLDACVANCGRIFHLEVASREFETEYRRLISRAQPAIAARLRSLLRKWADGEFRSDPQLDLIPALAKQLRAEQADGAGAPSQSANASTTSAAAAAAAAQKEQEDLARAIALSLKESNATAAPASSTLYPRVDTEAIPAQPAQTPRKVRALYDFEAAEDNELTFMAGEMVHVTDSSDPNWWKGYNERGEGLFPANFVTFDLSEPAPKVETRGPKSVQFAESTSGLSAPVEDAPVDIDEQAMDAALALLHEADVEARSDESALVALESRVLRMGPLVDAALERADTRHARLTQLSAELVRALNLYHELMRDPKPIHQGVHGAHMHAAPFMAGAPAPPPPPPQPFAPPPGAPPPRC
ncbi:signal transducing adapter molecule 1 [Hyposmocoma kahamanoa]|uniref:signal transducing adapter molecule 1 n=1 Tax=Hyposmocoma kahamanoa TaxID=1477025 RepID=UPI000E6D96FE|nr:signal transducing adapter molecule 1 [Hyposmocoma kahamanoa]